MSFRGVYTRRLTPPHRRGLFGEVLHQRGAQFSSLQKIVLSKGDLKSLRLSSRGEIACHRQPPAWQSKRHAAMSSISAAISTLRKSRVTALQQANKVPCAFRVHCSTLKPQMCRSIGSTSSKEPGKQSNRTVKCAKGIRSIVRHIRRGDVTAKCCFIHIQSILNPQILSLPPLTADVS